MAIVGKRPTIRTRAELEIAKSEFFDRRWYYRSTSVQRTEDIRAMEASLLAKYPDLAEPLNDYELGVLDGKHAAIRWLFGMAWDDQSILDT